jgi:hypothetical protein
VALAAAVVQQASLVKVRLPWPPPVTPCASQRACACRTTAPAQTGRDMHRCVSTHNPQTHKYSMYTVYCWQALN